jgi:serine protease Do
LTGKAVEEGLGLIVQEINPEIRNRFETGISEGVIITNVAPGGTAATAGLEPGDVILEINKNKVSNLDNYKKSMDSVSEGQNVLFLIQRGSNTIYVALKLEGGKGGDGKG